MPSQKNPIAAPNTSADVPVTGNEIKAAMINVRARYINASGTFFDVTPPIQPKNNAPAILNRPTNDSAQDAIDGSTLLSRR